MCLLFVIVVDLLQQLTNFEHKPRLYLNIPNLDTKPYFIQDYTRDEY